RGREVTPIQAVAGDDDVVGERLFRNGDPSRAEPRQEAVEGTSRSRPSSRAGPLWSRNGVTSIVSTATARNVWYRPSDGSAVPRPSRASTKENSPICETARPASRATRPE